MSAKKKIIKPKRKPSQKKKAELKENKISNFYKQSLVEYMIACLLKRNEDLTKVQVRKIFSYGYRNLWKNGEGLYNKIKKQTKETQSPIQIIEVIKPKKKIKLKLKKGKKLHYER